MAESQPFTLPYFLFSLLWLTLFFLGIVIVMRSWLPGRREHHLKMRELELAEKREQRAHLEAMAALEAQKKWEADPLKERGQSTRFPTWTSSTRVIVNGTEVDPTSPEGKEVLAQSDAMSAQVDKAMSHLDHTMKAVDEAFKRAFSPKG